MTLFVGVSPNVKMLWSNDWCKPQLSRQLLRTELQGVAKNLKVWLAPDNGRERIFGYQNVGDFGP